MMNTELKKMKTEELELVTGCGLVVDLPDEKVKDFFILDSGFAVKEIPDITDIFTNW